MGRRRARGRRAGRDGLPGRHGVCRDRGCADTRPYRAPELLFSPKTYDAAAADLWAAGATLAEFYRPLRAASSESSLASSPASSGSNFGHEALHDPLENGRHPLNGAQPRDELDDRDGDGDMGDAPVPLFDASFGEIGLAASIFRLLGSPNADSWPVSAISALITVRYGAEVQSFERLPDAAKMMFEARAARPLSSALDAPNGFVRVLESVIRLEPARRASAAEVVHMLGEDGLGEGAQRVLRGWVDVRERELERLLRGEETSGE